MRSTNTNFSLSSCTYTSIVYIFVEIILIAIFYSPSLLLDYFSTLDTLLTDIVPLNDYIFLLSDFKFVFCRSYNQIFLIFFVLLISMVFHFFSTFYIPNTKLSILDLIIVTQPERIRAKAKALGHT